MKNPKELSYSTRSDVTKQIVAFHNFVDSPKNQHKLCGRYVKICNLTPGGT